MTGKLLWRGMLAGIIAALLATLFARAFAEPQIDLAIAYEAAHAAHHAGADEVELVSRETQKGFGLLAALGLYGAAVGGIFALTFAYGYGRIAQIGPRSFALVMAALAFVLIVVVPGIKYPQTPPAVGQHETVGLRTAAYFAMIALSVCAALIAGRLRAALVGSLRGFDAGLLAVAGYVAVVALGALLLPAIDEVPVDFPAGLLWNFRLASLGSQLLLWMTIGVLFGRWAAATLEQGR
ncbi:CbtA family protein [Novosphingobium sp. JCM 18896]|uniref:CbtA family protein n=1 Tax=Novosphingobium sp. JCM 18896 TaxID=2989731 RepID=UPI002221CD5E|nr:CbtA family protein [Novosphingobium sp. JCM 18896]MCW1429930.1 CbtA family protein [Novosphingobium sp. JCM 18896]